MLTRSYFLEDRFAWLTGEPADWADPNIGRDGRNLTICFLSMNRTMLSIRLLQSIRDRIPHFAGRILIADNGSEAGELAALRAFLAQAPELNVDLLEFGENFGVAGGRNRAFAEVKTDWILSLDNDIYFIDDPLARLQQDLSDLGCHFLSVPLVNPDRETLYAFGGQLQPQVLEDGTYFLRLQCMLPANAPLEESLKISPLGEAFLTTFLFGGASVLKRESFRMLGGFDEGMFVGFEDLDFSLRLVRAGVKVGNSASRAFVHDHPPADADADRAYERTRYSRSLLKKSADYLEAKTGFKVWSQDVDEWLEASERARGLDSAKMQPEDDAASQGKAPRKPKIALIVDADNWAFANIAQQIRRHLSDRFDFTIISTSRLNEINEIRWKAANPDKPFVDGPQSFAQVLLLSKDFDIVHVFWRVLLTMLGPQSICGETLATYAKYLGMSEREFLDRYTNGACFTTSVYDHLFSLPQELDRLSPVFNRYCVAYTVSSTRLERIYKDAEGISNPAAVIPDGVDADLFYPQNLERLTGVGARDLVVGWVGNSQWCGERDSKGVHTILKPAIERLQAKGYAIRLEMADRAVRFTPQREMVDFYASIDVLACTSEIEGTPNPVLEAMACGVPIVSTDVGIVPDALGPLQRTLILDERSVESLERALSRILDNPSMLGDLSSENLKQINAWRWSDQAERFSGFFEMALRRKAGIHGEARSKMCMLPFTTPSQEPSGAIRLCSASSTFEYRAETDMGNAREVGLSAVWRGEKYRRVREGLLLGGESLEPYCAGCEYRHDAPAWVLQLHLALHAWHEGVRTPDVVALIAARRARYQEYATLLRSFDATPHVCPPEIVDAPAHLPSLPETLVSAAALPIFIDLNSLNRCNVSCVMCPPAIKHDRGEARDPYYRLTLDEYRRVTADMNVKSAHFVGAYAEPLLNKEIFDLVRYAHDHGAFTAITTNAQPLVPSFASRLIDAGLDMMSISLHGATAATAEAVMKRSKFKRVLENIRTLQKLKAERGTTKPEIYFNFVSQVANIAELPAFIALAHELGVRHVQVIHLIDGDEAVDASTNLVRHPALLAPNVKAAQEAGRRLGVNVIVSPAYADLLQTYDQAATRDTRAAAYA